ncbi:hypothetical protein OPAG_06871 [Rhodococcus opacus PD630]|nr:hypothetical protein OPAG_06871 [Rhodococcus opacus PD630]
MSRADFGMQRLCAGCWGRPAPASTEPGHRTDPREPDRDHRFRPEHSRVTSAAVLATAATAVTMPHPGTTGSVVVGIRDELTVSAIRAGPVLICTRPSSSESPRAGFSSFTDPQRGERHRPRTHPAATARRAEPSSSATRSSDVSPALTPRRRPRPPRIGRYAAACFHFSPNACRYRTVPGLC